MHTFMVDSGNFVTFHGIDGTGKTKTASVLAGLLRSRGTDAYDWADFARKKRLVTMKFGEFDEDAISRLAIESSELRAALRQGDFVLRDRWLLDKLASAELRKGESFSRMLGESAAEKQVRVPDMSVVLLCEESVRRARIEKRGNPSAEDMIENKPGTPINFLENYLLRNAGQYSLRTMTVDATNLTVGQVAEEVLREIDRHLE